MNARAFLDLSTKLLADMNAWVAEAGKDAAITPADLSVLKDATQIIEKVTLREVETSPENFANQEREGHD